MATTSHNLPVGPDTPITVKIIIDNTNRRFKLPLRDLSANVLPTKLRTLLAIPPEQQVRFERFSDSAASYVTLDSSNPAIYKQLYRAAKAKLKLRLRATVERKPVNTEIPAAAPAHISMDQKKAAEVKPEPRSTFLETVLSPPTASAAAPSSKSFQKTCQYSPTCAIPGAFDLDLGSSQPAVKAPATGSKDIYSLPTLPSMSDFPSTSYTIDCNHCGSSVPNEHYHCGICEGGDYDLCKACIDAGVTCDGDEHWLLKRTIRNGLVVPSTTQTLPSKKTVKAEDFQEEQSTPSSPGEESDDLTCNSCICQMPAREFVTCQDCPDYDLCLSCFQEGEHGHHPAHTFDAQEPETLGQDHALKMLAAAGRGVAHDAICDGCDEDITGIRHKCLSCPDFDYCSDCVVGAERKHPGHRFAPIYTPIKLMRTVKPVHRGIYCDGPMCTGYKGYIAGDRYKCAVCHDTDFCANCESLPGNWHNASHPLIKIKLAMRQVSISTEHQNENGEKIAQLGDRPLAKNASTETTKATSANAATQVQTVAEFKPAEVAPVAVPSKELQAWYVSDSTPDGTKVSPNHYVSQSWTVRNPGPHTWPAGCAVYYIGGDDMRNLDNHRPSSVSAVTTASRSNVLSTPLEPGKTTVFTVLLKSSAREGKAISYWRLKTPGGVPFGHKLWVDIDVRSTPVDMPIRTHILPAVPAAVESVSEPKQEDKSASSSTMIFPTLEKESPVSSVHDVRGDENEEVPAPVMEPTTKTDEQELLEDVESLELEDSDSEDDAFLTDEEYDILDVEDEDFLSEVK